MANTVKKPSTEIKKAAEEVKAEVKAAVKKVETKVAAKKTVVKKAVSSAKKAAATKVVTPDFDSIYASVKSKAKVTKFKTNFLATQITLRGNVDPTPLYVKVDNKKVEVAPYEYNDASFYIDGDVDVFASVLNGKKCIYDAINDGSVCINGDTGKAILFVKAFFA